MNIRAIRESLRMTQPEMAEALGVCRGSIAHWEGGTRQISRMAERSVERLVHERVAENRAAADFVIWEDNFGGMLRAIGADPREVYVAYGHVGQDA